MSAREYLASLIMISLISSGIRLIPVSAGAHCDTLDGPVVTTAKAALEKGDVTPVLKWVRRVDEPEIREMFKKALAVRSRGAAPSLTHHRKEERQS